MLFYLPFLFFNFFIFLCRVVQGAGSEGTAVSQNQNELAFVKAIQDKDYKSFNSAFYKLTGSQRWTLLATLPTKTLANFLATNDYNQLPYEALLGELVALNEKVPKQLLKAFAYGTPSPCYYKFLDESAGLFTVPHWKWLFESFSKTEDFKSISEDYALKHGYLEDLCWFRGISFGNKDENKKIVKFLQKNYDEFFKQCCLDRETKKCCASRVPHFVSCDAYMLVLEVAGDEAEDIQQVLSLKTALKMSKPLTITSAYAKSTKFKQSPMFEATLALSKAVNENRWDQIDQKKFFDASRLAVVETYFACPDKKIRLTWHQSIPEGPLDYFSTAMIGLRSLKVPLPNSLVLDEDGRVIEAKHLSQLLEKSEQFKELAGLILQKVKESLDVHFPLDICNIILNYNLQDQNQEGHLLVRDSLASDLNPIFPTEKKKKGIKKLFGKVFSRK